MKTKAITYRQLRDQLATLRDAQLDSVIIWWGEERGGYIGGVQILEERYITTDTRDGMWPISAHDGEPPPEDEIEDSLPIGTVILLSDIEDRAESPVQP